MISNCSWIEETGRPETKLQIKFNIKRIYKHDISHKFVLNEEKLVTHT